MEIVDVVDDTTLLVLELLDVVVAEALVDVLELLCRISSCQKTEEGSDATTMEN